MIQSSNTNLDKQLTRRTAEKCAGRYMEMANWYGNGTAFAIFKIPKSAIRWYC